MTNEQNPDQHPDRTELIGSDEQDETAMLDRSGEPDPAEQQAWAQQPDNAPADTFTTDDERALAAELSAEEDPAVAEQPNEGLADEPPADEDLVAESRADEDVTGAAPADPELPAATGRPRWVKRTLIGVGAAALVAVAGVVAVGAASADPAATHSKGGGLRDALHGEFVVQGQDGGTTVKRLQNGTVTTLDGGTLTVTSTDDHIGTFTVPDGLDLTGIAVGDQVQVVATVSGDTATADSVREPGTAGNGKKGRGGRGEGQDRPANPPRQADPTVAPTTS